MLCLLLSWVNPVPVFWIYHHTVGYCTVDFVMCNVRIVKCISGDMTGVSASCTESDNSDNRQRSHLCSVERHVILGYFFYLFFIFKNGLNFIFEIKILFS